MGFADYLTTGTLAVLLGLDRVAFLQCLVSRPLVAAPLTGWLLGVPLTGLQVGMLLELLWLGRLPVGAVIPPDDTQVAIGATTLALTLDRLLALQGMPAVILCVLVAIPLGQIGQFADGWARRANGRLSRLADTAAAAGDARQIEWLHLNGSGHFALAGLATCAAIVLAGTLILYPLAPLLIGTVRETGLSLQYSFTLIGAAAVLGTLNVRRGLFLFGVAFVATLIVLWLR
jgi:mannose/fructose/N-acetylgalactosamine-specific phosphotransferase system component IIC